MGVQLTDNLRAEYSRLFDTCEIVPLRMAKVDAMADSIGQNRPRYEQVGGALGIPWFFIGAIHGMECSLNFKCHLHNGDPLTARTTHVPAGRPLNGAPPFAWEDSATDALKVEGFDKVDDWSIPGILYQLEKYNGFGYRTRHPEVLTPYLWSFSQLYKSGKYVADGTFDPDAVSGQCGAAVVLRRMAEKGLIQFDGAGHPVASPAEPPPDPLATFGPLVSYSETEFSEQAKALQQFLNTLPGIYLLVDGKPGRRTSDAFRRATGHYLKGDPRAGV